MTTQNSINRMTSVLKTDSIASDGYEQFSIATVNKYRMGIDADDSDSFKIAYGSSLGVNDYFVMDTDGNLTLPYQPAFFATMTTSVSSVTGDGTVYTIIQDVEKYDVGANYNNANGIFTAPVDGYYFLSAALAYQMGFITGATYFLQYIKTTKRNYVLNNLPGRKRVNNFYAVTNTIKTVGSVIANMDAGDTAYHVVEGVGGLKNGNVYIYTTFLSGFLAT